MVHVLQTTQNVVFHVVVLQKTAKKCTKIDHARVHPMHCDLATFPFPSGAGLFESRLTSTQG